MIITTARKNSQYNVTAPAVYYDYEGYTIQPGNIENYMITAVIGKGKYSEVFKGVLKNNEQEKIVVKVLKPIKISKIYREILILKNLDHQNIIKLKDVVFDKYTKYHSLIFNYVKHKDSYSTFEKSTPSECLELSKQILSALRYAHSKGVMHRDIKPGNLLIYKENDNSVSNKLYVKIIDWGLAEFYIPKKDYSVRVASKFYKAPELLVEYPYYDYSVDIWSFACILAEMLFKKQPFFYSKGPVLAEIIKFLGKSKLKDYLEKYQIPFTAEISNFIGDAKDSFNDFFDFSFIPEHDSENDIQKDSKKDIQKDSKKDIQKHSKNGIQQSKDYKKLLDLLKHILIYDHKERFTAEECLNFLNE